MKKIAIIYLPSQGVTQSGQRKTKFWILKFQSANTDYKDQLMGWNGSKDTDKQVTLNFDSCADAQKYAIRKHLDYKILPTMHKTIKNKSYSMNFTKNH